ncbi:MAG: cupin domain-containing protein [Phycisphaeraceae bacterium]|nr:MAG: cupin domain-containing protein [Phycisphaeraceae bacterium]
MRTQLNVLGVDTTLLLTADQTGGAATLVMLDVAPGAGTPPHVHEREDESFLVLDGEIDITLDGRTTRLGAGEAAWGARGVPHMFRNSSPRPARLVVTATPGGLDRFFVAADEMFPEGAEIDPARLVRLLEEFGMKPA